jgi:hypothetical protein
MGRGIAIRPPRVFRVVACAAECLPAGGGLGHGLNAHMSDVTPVRRPRRWWRAVRIVLFLLLVALVIAFCWAPTLGLWAIHDRLPWSQSFPHGAVSVQQAATAPIAKAQPEVQIVGSPSALRGIGSAAAGWWMPPGLLRGGQNVVGDLTLPILREEPFRWQVLVAGSEATPLVGLRVSHVDLTRFLRLNGQTVLMVGGAPIMRCIYLVDWGRITDDNEVGQSPLVLRQKVVARGSILLIAGQAQRTLKVERLAGHAWTTFVPVAEGYRLQMRVAIEEADAEPITLPIVGDARPMLMKQLETAANDGLENGLEKVVLPPWFPTSLRVDATVE